MSPPAGPAARADRDRIDVAGLDPAQARWVRRRRRRLRAEIAALEEALVDAGEEPAAPPADAPGLLARLEAHAVTLRTQALTTGLVPPDPDGLTDEVAGRDTSEAGRAAAYGAPSDWLDRLAVAQSARAQAEARAARLEQALEAATEARDRALAAVPHLFDAVAAGTGGEPPGARVEREVEPPPAPAAERQLSTIDATRFVVRAIGPKRPTSAAQIVAGVQRISSGEVNPKTIRSNLVRLRDAGEVDHDAETSTWWLRDPADPEWRPPDDLPLRLVGES